MLHLVRIWVAVARLVSHNAPKMLTDDAESDHIPVGPHTPVAATRSKRLTEPIEVNQNMFRTMRS